MNLAVGQQEHRTEFAALERQNAVAYKKGGRSLRRTVCFRILLWIRVQGVVYWTWLSLRIETETLDRFHSEGRIVSTLFGLLFWDMFVSTLCLASLVYLYPCLSLESLHLSLVPLKRHSNPLRWIYLKIHFIQLEKNSLTNASRHLKMATHATSYTRCLIGKGRTVPHV